MASAPAESDLDNQPAHMTVKLRSITAFSNKTEQLFNDWQSAMQAEAHNLDHSSEQESDDDESSSSSSALPEITRGKAVRFIEYAIAGIDRKHTERTTISMGDSTITNEWLSNNTDGITHRLDFDSLLGRSSELAWKSDLQVFPLFNHGFPIKKSLHIGHVPNVTGRKDGATGRKLYAEEMHIPHISFAEAEEHRSSTRLFFPELVDWDNFPLRYELTKPELAKIYAILRKAVIDTVGSGEAGHWQATYAAEAARASKGGSKPPEKSSRLIPQAKVQDFGQRLLRRIQRNSWGKGAYFFLEVHGTRGSTHHRLRDHRDELEKYLSCIDQDLINKETFWIDVGHEMQAKQTVLWWRRDAHVRLLTEALGMGEEDVRELIKSKSFYRDEACQLVDAAGFRLVLPNRVKKDLGITYIQAYCTEKMAAYLPGNRTINLAYQCLLDPNLKQIVSYQKMMDDIHRPSQEEEVTGNARFEVRVCLSKVQTERGYIVTDNNQMLLTVYQFPSWDWWMFKRMRTNSMVQAILFWSKGGPGKIHPSSIALVTTLVYMLNSIVSRPVDEPAEQNIHECITEGCWDITVVQVDPDERPLEHKRYCHGLLFPANLIGWSEQIECPHLGLELLMPETIYPKLFGNRSLYAIQGMLLANNEQMAIGNAPRDRLDRRITTKGPRRAFRHVGPTEEEDVINLAPQEVQFIPVIQNNNGDMGAAIDRMNADSSKTLARFYMDILVRAPNQGNLASSPPYCRLGLHACQAATAATFQEQNIAEIWYKVIVKPSTQQSWDANFDNLFPTKAQVVEEDQRRANGIKVAKQGYEQSQYYSDWCATLRTLEEASTTILRATVKRRIDQLLWVPFTAKDKLWRTLAIDSTNLPDRRNCSLFPQMLDATDKKTAVIILIHQRKPWKAMGGFLMPTILLHEREQIVIYQKHNVTLISNQERGYF